MLDDLLRRLRSALMGVPPEQARRYASIDAWVAGLSRDEARRLAGEVLENPAWFHTERGDASGGLPAEVPPTVKEFYSRYVSAIGRFCDLQLVASDCAPSEARRDLIRVGREDAHVELCTRRLDDQVLLVATDVGSDEVIEGSMVSVYHAGVRVAADLGYLTYEAP